MSDVNGRYKKAPSRKKTAPVKHIGVSEDARKAYEELIRNRDERDKTYGRHLATEKRER